MFDYLTLLAEFLGTFLFTLSILVTGNPLFIGLTLAFIIWLLSKVSGGHVNPAVSLAFFLKGSLSNAEFAGYTASQLLGAASSFYVFKALM